MSIYVRGQRSSPTGRIKFTPQEDAALKYYIEEFGTNNWKKVAKMMPGRNAKQCRDRFSNYLSDSLHRVGPWENTEDEILLEYLEKIGPKRVEIARHIPGRSGNDAKNRWYKHLSKAHPNITEKAQNLKQRIQEKDVEIVSIDKAHVEYSQPIEKLWEQYSISAMLQ